MQKLGLLFLVLLTGCASHRKQANCEEIRYRLDHVQYEEDQRDWIEEEWKTCTLEADSLAQADRKQYQGIYQQFATDSTQEKSHEP